MVAWCDTLLVDVQEMLNERVPMRIEAKTVGEAVIQKVFEVTAKIDNRSVKIPVAGCRCLKGTLYRDKMFKLLRGTEVIHEGTLYSLKHFKVEVSDIKEGLDCGLAFSDHLLGIEEGDLLICYDEIQVQPEIDWDLPF